MAGMIKKNSLMHILNGIKFLNQVSAYALSSACLLVLCGRLADLYGRKLVFFAGSIWLFVFSIACGFAKGKPSCCSSSVCFTKVFSSHQMS